MLESVSMKESVNGYGIKEFLQLLLSYKAVIFVVTFLFSSGAVFYSLSLSNVYQSESLVESARDNENSLGQAAAQIGQLASLAGFSLGSGGSSNVASDLAILESRAFLRGFIERNDIIIPLFAGNEWSINDQRLILDSEIYSEKSKTWTRKVNPPQKPEPSLNEAVEKFKEIFKVEHDLTSGLITLSVEFYSPIYAHDWLSALISDFNLYVKSKEVNVIEQNIAYLESQATQVENAGMRTVFYSLLEEQQKKVMLAHSSDEYVFRIIDPAFVPEKKAGPKRALICVAGALLGFFLSVFVVLFREYFRSEK